MANLSDSVLDAGLADLIASATTLHICSAEPANYAGIAAVELAQHAVTLTGPSDATGGGRKATIPTATGQDVDTTGTATHWVLSNGVDTLLASNQLAAPVALDAAGTYTIAAIDVAIADATSA